MCQRYRTCSSPVRDGTRSTTSGIPVLHVEAVGDDARAGPELAPAPRAQTVIALGADVERDDGGRGEIDRKGIVAPDCHEVRHALALGRPLGERDQLRIDLHAHRAGAEDGDAVGGASRGASFGTIVAEPRREIVNHSPGEEPSPEIAQFRRETHDVVASGRIDNRSRVRSSRDSITQSPEPTAQAVALGSCVLRRGDRDGASGGEPEALVPVHQAARDVHGRGPRAPLPALQGGDHGAVRDRVAQGRDRIRGATAAAVLPGARAAYLTGDSGVCA